jgi:putative ABC transport system permease protein
MVGRKLMKRFGWKLGDRIPLRGTIYPGTWELNIRGVFDNKKQEDDTGAMFLHYKYLDERGPFKGEVAWFVVKIEKPENALAVAKAIDAEFSGASIRTLTETEQAFQTDFVKRLGNIKLILMIIGGVVFFTLLLVTGSTMAMAIRERTGEIGVMKTLGFSDRLVLALLLSESMAFALIGGGLGLVLIKLYTLGGDPTGGMLRSFHLSPLNMLLGLVITLATGIGSGIVPALGAMRLSIVDAMRRV